MKTQSSTQGAGLRSRAEQSGSGDGSSRLPVNQSQRLRNRTLPTASLLKLLASQAPNLFNLAEVVGRWVWVQFTEAPGAELRRQLAQLGFHWNRTRQAWQHPCGCFRDRAYAGDPRRFYGSYFPSAVKPL